MFYYIDGTVSMLEPNLAVIDCGGVGYALNASHNTVGHLQPGKRARLYTYLQVKEEIFELYGFYSLAEKRCFEMLISVSGVGPKAALSVLSSNTPEGVAMAILSGNEKALTAAQGVGKRIAQRVILELKDKLQKEAQTLEMPALASEGTTAVVGQSKMTDAASALAVLGYGPSEIAAALKGLDAEHMALEDMIRAALKNMMK